MNKKETKFKQTEIGKIPEDWDTDKLGTLLTIKGRIGWKGLKKSESNREEACILVNGPDIKNGRVKWSSCLRIPMWRYEESPEIMLKNDDIIMTKDGTIGKIAFIKELPSLSTVASGIFVIRHKSDKLDQKYLYQIFSSKNFKNLIAERIEGTVIPHLYQRDITELIIPLPSVPEQIKIAEILDQIDLKIDLNNKMNKTLETIGQALFKRWFVDFEFSDENGKPYKSSSGNMIESELGMIPKGWKIYNFIDLVKQLKPGTNYQPDRVLKGVPFITGKNVQNGFLNLKDVKYVTKEEYGRVHSIWAPEENDLLITRIGTLGNIGLIRKKDLPIVVHYNNIDIKHKLISYQLLYYLLNSEIFQAQYHLKKKQAVQEYITIDDVERIKIALPDNLIKVKQYENIFIDIFNKFEQNFNQIENLAQIRDALLPKLMSGEIRVPVE